MSPEPLAGQVAVVVGATGGVGSATSRCLAAAGCRVVVGFRRDQAAAEALAGSLPGADHSAMTLDVTDSPSLEALAREIDRRYGTVDILVNSAGTTRFVPHADLSGLDDALIDEIFRVNWRGPFATIRALQRLLAHGKGGVVVNISSIAGVSGIGSNVAYCASKAALSLMTVSLARALAPAIRVVSVAPGLVDTDFVKGLDPAWRQEQENRTPLGRLVQPDDIGRAVVAAASLSCSTGSTITVDGGRLLS